MFFFVKDLYIFLVMTIAMKKLKTNMKRESWFWSCCCLRDELMHVSPEKQQQPLLPKRPRKNLDPPSRTMKASFRGRWLSGTKCSSSSINNQTLIPSIKNVDIIFQTFAQRRRGRDLAYYYHHRHHTKTAGVASPLFHVPLRVPVPTFKSFLGNQTEFSHC